MTYNDIMEMELDNLATTCKKMNLTSLIKLSNGFYDLYYEKQDELEEYINILRSDDITDLMRMQYLEMRNQLRKRASNHMEKI